MDGARQREFVAAAAAGYALSRMLSSAPDDGILERLHDPLTRSSWPLADETSLAALAGIGAGSEAELVRADWNRVLGPDGTLSLRESAWREVPEAEVVDELGCFYRSVELQRSATAALPADHLAVELFCLAHLTASAAGPSVRGEVGWVEERCRRVADLRACHLDLFWEPAMTEFGRSVEVPELQAVPALVGGFLTALEQVTVPLGAEP